MKLKTKTGICMRLKAAAIAAALLPLFSYGLDEAAWKESVHWTAPAGESPEVVYTNGWMVLKFTNTNKTAAATLTLDGTAMGRVLAIGGGGGGGKKTGSTNPSGGGGGAGGIVATNSYYFKTGEYSITAGAGGAGKSANGDGDNGGDTIVAFGGKTIFKAVGGGGGGANSTVGHPGGSGGGTAKRNAAGGEANQATSGLPAAATHYGNAGGGNGTYNGAAGGGGGAGKSGGAATARNTAGAGGAGVTSDITGAEVAYGGGGGGGAYGGSGEPGDGGDGGGGSGAKGSDDAEPGTDGFGGGGGGASGGDSGKGGDGAVIVRLEAIAINGEIPKPADTNFVYDGSAKYAFDGTYIDFACDVSAVANATSDFAYAATNAGTYSFRVDLREGFKFAGGDSSDHATVEWTIEKATNRLENLSISGWKTGASPVSPTVDCLFGEPVFSYAERTDGVAAEDADFSYATPPDVEGDWWVRATVEGTDNYTEAEPLYAAFTIRKGGVCPVPGLACFADIVFSGYGGEYGNPARDIPVLVAVSEGNPYGFTYNETATDGSDIRFADSAGELLPHVIYTNSTGEAMWNPGGESVFAVYLPVLRRDTSITMCWGEIDGLEDPIPEAEGAEAIYSKYDKDGEAVASQLTTGWYAIDSASRDAGTLLKNRWIAEPALAAVGWTESEWKKAVAAGGIVATAGETIGGGEVSVLYRGYGMSETHGPEAIETAGYYEAVFTAAETNGFASISKAIAFEIEGVSEYSDAGGTISGRVLLMNNDANGVSLQGHANTKQTTAAFLGNPSNTYWEFLATNKIPQLNLKDETESMLRSVGGSNAWDRLWHIVDCRHGNTYPINNNALLETGYNYLPYSSTSRSITTRNATGTAPRNAVGQCVMRNTLDACIYSPCYEEGVGTIYFDAVNATTQSKSNCVITVEVCTNCIVTVQGETRNAPPTDENLFVLSSDGSGSVATNYYGGTGTSADNETCMVECEWAPLEFTPYYVSTLETTDGGATNILTGADAAKPRAATTNLVLDVAEGGSTNRFYRIVAHADLRMPARFRIKRTAVSTGNADDIISLILIDNIIASFPAMRVDLLSYGSYDAKRDGKDVLGQSGAWNVPFPSVSDGELYARARPCYYTNSLAALSDPATMVKQAAMQYRWRYLNQYVGEWRTVVLDHRGGYEAQNPLALDNPGVEGDIEFYYTLDLRAPHYVYFDYSGLGLGVPGWSENIPAVTNRLESATPGASASIPQTCGEDWFVRLRQGASDYESVEAVCIFSNSAGRRAAVTNTVPLHVSSDHVWRGWMKTAMPTNSAVAYPFDTVTYHLEARNRQEAGSTSWATNTVFWRARDSVTNMPVSGTMEICGAHEWSTMPYDWKTGHYLFQATDLDNALYLSVVHADYQNFNSWHDARMDDHKFVGNATVGETNATGTVSGAASNSQDYHQPFTGWERMEAHDDEHWTESFTVQSGQDRGMGWPNYYKTLSNETSPQGWSLSQGMAVYKKYRDPDDSSGFVDLAFQMQGGGGGGSISFVNSAVAPRGIDTISYRARVAEVPAFANFAYYDAGYKYAMSNYTVHALTAFDRAAGNSFDGNASISLVAYYRPGIGCYEFRMEQTRKDEENAVNGRNGQNFSIHRWRYSGGRLSDEILGDEIANRSYTNRRDWQVRFPTSASGNHNSMFLSVSNGADNATWIMAGIGRGLAANANTSMANLSGAYCCISLRDTSKTLRLTAGAAGFGTANSEGVIMHPRMLKGNASPMQSDSGWGEGVETTLPAEHYSSDKDDIDFEDAIKSEDDIAGWCLPNGIMAAYRDGTDWGLRGVVATNIVGVFVAEAGVTTNWTLVASNTVHSFKMASSLTTASPYISRDSAVSLRVMDGEEDPRVDIVVDDLKVTQWRGTDWSDSVELESKIPGWERIDTSSASHTNFVFTSAWVTNVPTGGGRRPALLLSAKRAGTYSGASPATIRSPLMDGYQKREGYTRGIGLGMFSFSFAAANSNAVLELQIATNGLSDTTMAAADLDDSLWKTVTNYTFAANESGTRSMYLGSMTDENGERVDLHGVAGAMRLRMKQSVVEAAAKSDDPKYGEIFIYDVFCRDEPAIDQSSWWGWNLRTLDWQATSDEEDEDRERIMLSDRSEFAGNCGLSLALNNSTTDDVYKPGDETFKRHVPFVQTPLFAGNLVGEVTFRARKYDAGDENAFVAIYGSKSGDENGEWQYVGGVVVTNAFYTTYGFKGSDLDANYSAFRFAVINVPDAATDELRGPVLDEKGSVTNGAGRAIYTFDGAPPRVLFDEMGVMQAMRAEVGFRNVGAFRSQALDAALQYTTAVRDFPGPLWQPLCGEEFGIQCEVYAKQLPEEVDFTKGVRVKLEWYYGDEPWGYENWADDSYKRETWLSPAADSNMVFRSGHMFSPTAIIPEMCDLRNNSKARPGAVVQYMLTAYWYPSGEDARQQTTPLASGDWVNPPWYSPVDKNAGGDGFAAYTILDSVAPGWAWINEINIFGGKDANGDNIDANCQYIEVAAPVEADLDGWSVRIIEPYPSRFEAVHGAGYSVTNVLATFGDTAAGGPPETKNGLKNAASNMVFHVLASEKSAKGGRLSSSAGEIDGVWKRGTASAIYSTGEIWYTDRIAFQLVRPSGVVEHEIVVRGFDWEGAYRDEGEEEPYGYSVGFYADWLNAQDGS
ncbi:MAG: hypothetical protein IIT98_06375, partial [Kiritimatiellae bacterium]|nr:hypothetical protein [Kiritimatiellia bacterium]